MTGWRPENDAVIRCIALRCDHQPKALFMTLFDYSTTRARLCRKGNLRGRFALHFYFSGSELDGYEMLIFRERSRQLEARSGSWVPFGGYRRRAYGWDLGCVYNRQLIRWLFTPLFAWEPVPLLYVDGLCLEDIISRHFIPASVSVLAMVHRVNAPLFQSAMVHGYISVKAIMR